MTIDERLEKLVERHEALTQTVEIIAGMQKENEKQHARTEQELRQTQKELRQFARLVRLVIVDHESRLIILETEDDADSSDGEAK